MALEHTSCSFSFVPPQYTRIPETPEVLSLGKKITMTKAKLPLKSGSRKQVSVAQIELCKIAYRGVTQFDTMYWIGNEQNGGFNGNSTRAPIRDELADWAVVYAGHALNEQDPANLALTPFNNRGLYLRRKSIRFDDE